jgi:hypothetical protein
VLVAYDTCRVLHQAATMTGTPEDISSMISLIETNPCLWNFALESYSRTDLTSLAWKEIVAELKDTGKEVRCIGFL